MTRGKCFASPLYGHTNSLDTRACCPSAHGTAVPDIPPGTRYSNNGGREAKHIVLKKLSDNSSSKNQWFDIFKHEFVILIWLPENGFTTCQYKASKGVYIPKRDNSYCSRGLRKAQIAADKCCICSELLTNHIEKSVEMGKCRPQLRPWG